MMELARHLSLAAQMTANRHPAPVVKILPHLDAVLQRILETLIPSLLLQLQVEIAPQAQVAQVPLPVLHRVHRAGTPPQDAMTPEVLLRLLPRSQVVVLPQEAVRLETLPQFRVVVVLQTTNLHQDALTAILTPLLKTCPSRSVPEVLLRLLPRSQVAVLPQEAVRLETLPQFRVAVVLQGTNLHQDALTAILIPLIKTRPSRSVLEATSLALLPIQLETQPHLQKNQTARKQPRSLIPVQQIPYWLASPLLVPCS